MEDNIYIPEIDYLHSISFLMTFPDCYFCIYFFYLKGRVTERRDRGTNLPSAGSLDNWTPIPNLGTRAHPGIPCVYIVSRLGAPIDCFPRLQAVS